MNIQNLAQNSDHTLNSYNANGNFYIVSHREEQNDLNDENGNKIQMGVIYDSNSGNLNSQNGMNNGEEFQTNANNSSGCSSSSDGGGGGGHIFINQAFLSNKFTPKSTNEDKSNSQTNLLLKNQQQSNNSVRTVRNSFVLITYLTEKHMIILYSSCLLKSARCFVWPFFLKQINPEY